MMLQNKIIILNPYFFFRALTCLFDVPLSIPIVEWHIHILLTWMLQCDSAPTFPDSFFFFLFRFFSSFLQPRFSYLIFENQDRGRTPTIIPGNHFIPIISNLPTIGGVLCGHGAS